MLNSIFVSRTRGRFRVPEGYIAVAKVEPGLASDLVRGEEAYLLFEGPNDLERWDVRARHGALEVERWKLESAGEKKSAGGDEQPPGSAEQLVVLSIQRGGRILPMHTGLVLEAGDLAAVAVYTEDRAAAHELLRARGFAPAPPEAAGDA
jgi:hypothetical protein